MTLQDVITRAFTRCWYGKGLAMPEASRVDLMVRVA